MKADLHIHTNFSDGIYSVHEIFNKAKSLDLKTISLTDHDNLSSFNEAQKYTAQFEIEFIPGVEISTDIDDREVHILAYYFDPNHAELKKCLKFFREERVYRAERIIKKLNSLGFNITLEQVKQYAKKGSLGRPHIAQALVENEYVSNFYEAFEKYIGTGKPAFEKKLHISAKSALKLIADAGGLSFVAHPGKIDNETLIKLINNGLDGIEAIHPSHSYSQILNYKKLASQFYLLISGGSDFHGGKREDEVNFGKYYITEKEIEAIKNRIIKR